MKKSFKYIKNTLLISALALMGANFLSCGESSGLGAAVDQEAPVVNLTSHEDNDIVPSAFTLTGTASDNIEVTLLTIDFEDADIHYQIVPGGNWQKKTSTSDWTDLTDGEGSCTSSYGVWTWSVYVDTSEALSSWTDANYEFEIVAKDAIGNTGANSSLTCSLTVDTASPDVSIYSPELLSGEYSAIATAASAYQLKDGNVISKLFNGDLTFYGRQSESTSFKELLIQFDNGQLSSGTAKSTGNENISNPTASSIAENVSLGDEDLTVYYSKTLTSSDADLRNWTLTVNESDWISDSQNSSLSTGKHLIRVVSSSVSDAGAWQKKVIGYFVWWPEADTPWITTYIGDESKAENDEDDYALYPSSNFSGSAQDDDGIASLTYSLMKKSDDSWTSYTGETALTLSDTGAKYSPWTVVMPSENGNYKITVTVTDLNGTTSSITRYCRILDVQPPKITISSPAGSSSLVSSSDGITSDGNVTLSGAVTDDGTVSSLIIVYLNPNLSDDADNKIKYLSGTDSEYDNATGSGYSDENGNILYNITLPDPVYSSDTNLNTYAFSKTLNLFDDLEIDGSSKYLNTQDFIFRAVDNGDSKTVQSLTLSGDSDKPSLAIESIQLLDASGNIIQLNDSDSYTFNDTDVLTLPQIQEGYQAIITGIWSDNSTTFWSDKSKISSISLTWGGNDYSSSVSRNNDGSWTASLSSLPTSSGAISAKITDYGKNTASASRSVFIENASASLEMVGSLNDDGSYKAGDVIQITLEFNKYVTFSGSNPSLTLNNDKTAAYASGNGSATIVFNYTVESGDDKDKLGVKALNQDGVTWKDTASSTEFSVTLPGETTKTLEGTRNICIDTTAPTISSVKAITSSGSYKAGSSIILMLEFSESVTIENVDNLKLVFTHTNSSSTKATTTSAMASGSKYVLFTYDVYDGENSSNLTLDSISYTNVTVTDDAGNAISAWTLPNTSFTNTIVIDTTAPAAPALSCGWETSSIVFTETSFTVSGEENATIEYTTDGGSSWNTYKEEVTLSNNGTYTVSARQTDKAGNISYESTPTQVTVDNGDLLTKITASTVNGSYTVGKEIVGKIVFRREVTLPQGATVTLNVANGTTTSKTAAITECESAEASGTEFTFTYTVVEDDSTELLDVTDWSFESVKINGFTVPIDFPESGNDKLLRENRSIKILTGNPSLKSAELSKTELTLTFDREISKNTGNIVLTQTSAYYAPAVLSASDYSNIPSAAQASYSKGTNGASLNSDSTLTNDTSTKYILDFNTDINDSTLVKYFTDANKHIVTVPVVSSAVTASGYTLTVDLSSTYTLPTKGAKYSVSLPASLVVDAVNNGNTADSSKTVTASGVEAPEIRINKEGQTITIGTASAPTTTSSTNIPAQASMKISCRTPDATIHYGISYATSAKTTVQNTITTSETDSPTVENISYSSSTDITVSDTLGTAITGYNNASGMKYAIAAYTDADEKVYEYAARTVLKLNISEYGNGNTQCAYGGSSGLTENSTTLTYGQLQIWVQGGDATSGGNSIDPFPLSWGTSTNFKLMTGSHTGSSMQGYYYWVTWDLTAKAYHGFVLGNVYDYGSDGTGPSTWYAADCGWSKYKSSYPLYPGETLEMITSYYGGNTYQFNYNLKCSN